MKETKYDAIAKVSMHGREHIVVLRPRENGMVLHTMYYLDELHSGSEVKVQKAGKFEKKELELAKQLIETLASPFKPEAYRDEYKQNVERLIESKRKGRKIAPIKPRKTAPVIDLMQALQESLRKTGGSKKTARKQAAQVA